jgi:hypothetical protein
MEAFSSVHLEHFHESVCRRTGESLPTTGTGNDPAFPQDRTMWETSWSAEERPQGSLCGTFSLLLIASSCYTQLDEHPPRACPLCFSCVCRVAMRTPEGRGSTSLQKVLEAAAPSHESPLDLVPFLIFDNLIVNAYPSTFAVL